MHWVENTQYCTVHGGKTQRKEEFLTGQSVLTRVRRKPGGVCSTALRVKNRELEALTSGGGMAELSVSIYF